MNSIRVVLIEDHDLTRIGLHAALEQVRGIEVVGEAANGRHGWEVLTHTQPDVAVIDIGLPDIDGIELSQRLKHSQKDAELLNTKVLILTMNTSKDAVLAAFAAGADSYSIKDVTLETLVNAIKITHEGNAWIEPAVARVVLEQMQFDQLSATQSHAEQEVINDTRAIEALDADTQKMVDSSSLTPKELEVLELIVAGCNNAQIAEALFVTVGTVKTHVRSILNKLCANDRTQAAVRALRSGLVE
ncbi:two-component response regulator [Crocosphaera subtropica ATCC 51142]|uniref:Two-component response regulator n=1 Tax=Crocosphaera subtropica (strain ATCC 51142 / BH68) TaxID=43989 RepID=B1WS69_CROS5|nr:response regulator transcription factor [Crocosphaera subtropica]ACB51855.1 two-component response regulator [Crocosphaera subtropica ATCC 51142]